MQRRATAGTPATPNPPPARDTERPGICALAEPGSRGTAALQVSLLLARVAGWPTGRGGHGGAGSREGAGRRPSLSGADRRLLLPQSALASAAAGKRSGHRRRRQAVPEFGVPARPLERLSLSRLGFCFLPKPRSPEAAGGKAERKKSSADSAGWDEGSLVRRGPARRARGQEKFYLQLRPGAGQPLTFRHREGSWTAGDQGLGRCRGREERRVGDAARREPQSYYKLRPESARWGRGPWKRGSSRWRAR